MAVCGGYRGSRIGVGTSELRAVVQAGALMPALGAYVASLASAPDVLFLLLVAAPIVVGLTLVVRAVARRRLHQLQRVGIGCRRTLVVGTAEAADLFREHLSREPFCGMVVAGLCLLDAREPDARADAATACLVLGGVADVARVVEQGKFDAVVVAGGGFLTEDYLRHLAWSLEGTAAELLVWPGLADISMTRLEIRPVIGAPLLHVRLPTFSGWKYVVKRTMDVTLTLAGLLVIWPLLAVVAASRSSCSSSGRCQPTPRSGKRPSWISTRGTAGCSSSTTTPGSRGWARWSDAGRSTNLPQLFNVLGGSMSLVGPRPHLADELANMPVDASRRLLVAPGLTGLWQVSGRSDLVGGEGLRLDLRYVENWSVTLDLHIIWRTFRAVVQRSGAF